MALRAVASSAAEQIVSIPVPIAQGGTNATSAAAALTSLGAAPTASPTFTGNVTVPGAAAPLLSTAAGITSGAGSSAGTLTNAPAIGNPTKWFPINDNGTTRYVPAW